MNIKIKGLRNLHFRKWQIAKEMCWQRQCSFLQGEGNTLVSGKILSLIHLVARIGAPRIDVFETLN